MEKFYSDEKNVQVILVLLKEHNIRKVIASPGTTNMALIVSMQNDPYFEMYSSVDERSAAYLACGLAAETGEPVVISCTGATASRNYLTGLTEAFYRKLPILVITSTQAISKVGHHIAQIIDNSVLPKDVVKLSVTLPIVKDDEDFWDCEVKVNKAVLELKRYGGGPVHINLSTKYSQLYDTKELPKVRIINRVFPHDKFPDLPNGKIAVFVGSHKQWNENEIAAIDKFCASNNAVVFCDHTSSYKGKYRVLYALARFQESFNMSFSPDLVIHIGEVSGDYYNMAASAKIIYRVSEDGEIRDTFCKLSCVFEMPELVFFNHYSLERAESDDSYLKICKDKLTELSNKIPELPFSNIWLALKMAHRIPEGSSIHFGILNSLRSWNFFELPQTVTSMCNVGGFGIDGGVSSLIGASLSNMEKLYFGVIGDLAFFYDMNVVGNRHVGNNLRILLVNNGKGTEFRQYNHLASQFGDDADRYIAAAGHFGNKSRELVMHYVQALGFDYISASNKDEFEQVYDQFLNPKISGRSLLLEVFTNSIDESTALESIAKIDKDTRGVVKNMAKNVLGDNGLSVLKKLITKKKSQKTD